MLRLLPVLALVACSANDTCALLGDYTGSFEGDASGELTIVLSESADGSDPLVDITLSGEGFDAVGHGTFHCDDGELIVTLLDDQGNELGSFTGSMIDESGAWELGSGESGTWNIAPD
jgi:hypothetical protein